MMHEYNGPPVNWPVGAVMMTKNLDLLTDEPLELAVALRKLAESKATESDVSGEVDEEWAAFAKAMIELVQKLETLNQPVSKTE